MSFHLSFPLCLPLCAIFIISYPYCISLPLSLFVSPSIPSYSPLSHPFSSSVSPVSLCLTLSNPLYLSFFITLWLSVLLLCLPFVSRNLLSRVSLLYPNISHIYVLPSVYLALCPFTCLSFSLCVFHFLSLVFPPVSFSLSLLHCVSPLCLPLCTPPPLAGLFLCRSVSHHPSINPMSLLLYMLSPPPSIPSISLFPSLALCRSTSVSIPYIFHSISPSVSPSFSHSVRLSPASLPLSVSFVSPLWPTYLFLPMFLPLYSPLIFYFRFNIKWLHTQWLYTID
jgi:hypothetical protein